jgi:hypothetical protein
MSDCSAHTIILALRDYWSEQGILNERCATDGEIAAFEARYNVILPYDLRMYFRLVNGTTQGRLGLEDEDLIGFWHLDQVRTFAEEDAGGGAKNPETLNTFAFADQSIWCYGFGIQLSVDPTVPAPVVSDGATDGIFRVASSFTEFIEGYLQHDPLILYPGPPFGYLK